MTDDLHITDKQYLIALTVFFFPYSLFEVRDIRWWQANLSPSVSHNLHVGQPPSNVALKKLRPSIWLSFIMLVWGIAMVRVISIVSILFSLKL